MGHKLKVLEEIVKQETELREIVKRGYLLEAVYVGLKCTKGKVLELAASRYLKHPESFHDTSLFSHLMVRLRRRWRV